MKAIEKTGIVVAIPVSGFKGGIKVKAIDEEKNFEIALPFLDSAKKEISFLKQEDGVIVIPDENLYLFIDTYITTHKLESDVDILMMIDKIKAKMNKTGHITSIIAADEKFLEGFAGVPDNLCLGMRFKTADKSKVCQVFEVQPGYDYKGKIIGPNGGYIVTSADFNQVCLDKDEFEKEYETL